MLFWGTPALQFVPWWTFAWDSLRQGVLPLWNPLNGLGAPLLANYQTAFFYPPNWLLLLLAGLAGAQGVAFGFTLLTILHLSWSGLGMAFFLRRLGFSWLGQVVGGLAFGLSGYVIARLGFFSMVWVAAWLPWVLYFADHIASPVNFQADPRAKRFVFSFGLAGCIAMQLLAGHAQLTWYSMLLMLAWVTVGALRGGGIRRIPWAWLSLGASIAVAVGLSAVQLIPTFEYLRLSPRANAVAITDVMRYSFWPWRLITLFSPNFFGNPATGDYWGYASYWEDHLYVGLLPLLLALSTAWLLIKGTVRRKRSSRWVLVAFLWLGMLVTFLLAFGQYTAIFPFLYAHVPTFAMFQAPARYLIWVAIALPILAAVGIEHWRCPTGRGLYWFRLGTAGAFAITLGAGLAGFFMKDVRLTFIRSTAVTGVWALGVGLLTLLMPIVDKRGWRKYWNTAVISWTLLDLLITGWSLNPTVNLGFYAQQGGVQNQAPALTENQRLYLYSQEEYDLKFRRFMRFNDFRPIEDWQSLRSVLLPDINLLDGIALVRNFDPLVTERYSRFVEMIDGLSLSDQARWLPWMGVGVVEHIDGREPAGVRFDPIPGVRRWRWYPCAKQVGSSQDAWLAVETMARQSAGPDLNRVILESQDTLPPNPENCSALSVAQYAQLTLEKPDQLTFTLTTASPGWFFLADSWYPGWQASIDQKSTPIYAADYLFRAVYVPAGTHNVTFLYRPFGFYFGGMFSILVLMLVTYHFTYRGRKHSFASSRSSE